jgi:multiple antibiotic resistance protein
MSIIHGGRALINIRGSLDDLASEIAMPFMTGVGTISVCILLGSKLNAIGASAVNFISAAIAFVVIAALALVRYHLSEKPTVAFDKVMGVFIRINAFFLGAFGVEMIKTGILNIIALN